MLPFDSRGVGHGAREDGGSAQQGLPAHRKAVAFRLWVSVTLGRSWPPSHLSVCWEQADTARLQAPAGKLWKSQLPGEGADSRNPSSAPGSLGAGWAVVVSPPGESMHTE